MSEINKGAMQLVPSCSSRSPATTASACLSRALDSASPLRHGQDRVITTLSGSIGRLFGAI